MIIEFSGGIGSGKTLSMVMYNYIFYNKFRLNNKKLTTYSNINSLKIPHKNINIMTNDLKAHIFNGLVLFDEFYLYADSRKSNSKMNIAVTN